MFSPVNGCPTPLTGWGLTTHCFHVQIQRASELDSDVHSVLQYHSGNTRHDHEKAEVLGHDFDPMAQLEETLMTVKV